MIGRMFLTLAIACLAGCGTDDSAPAKTMAISPGLRASCPDNPLLPAEKAAAGSAVAGYPVDLEIYNDDGVMIREFNFEYTPGQGPGSPQLLWDMKDSRGKQVPSGYYFMKTTITIEAGISDTQTRCVFVINDADRDKVQ